jgi:hypothetical protein
MLTKKGTTSKVTAFETTIEKTVLSQRGVLLTSPYSLKETDLSYIAFSTKETYDIEKLRKI